MAAPSLVVSNLGARANPRVARRASSRARRVAPPRASGGERRRTIEEGDASEASVGAAGRASSLPLGLTRRNLIDAAFGMKLEETLTCDETAGGAAGDDDAMDVVVEPPVKMYDTARKLVCNIQGGADASSQVNVNHIAEGIELSLNGKKLLEGEYPYHFEEQICEDAGDLLEQNPLEKMWGGVRREPANLLAAPFDGAPVYTAHRSMVHHYMDVHREE